MFRFKNFKKNHPIKTFLQKLFNYAFNQIEVNMREFGYGDVMVNKNMKILVKVFYKIIFDFESYSSYDDIKKRLLDFIDIINKHDHKKIALVSHGTFLTQITGDMLENCGSFIWKL